MSFTSEDRILINHSIVKDSLKAIDQTRFQYPENIELHMRRASATMLLENWQAAVAECDLLLTLDPESAYGFAVRGVSKAYLGQFIDARADIRRSLVIDPTFNLALEYHGHVEAMYDGLYEWPESFFDDWIHESYVEDEDA